MAGKKRRRMLKEKRLAKRLRKERVAHLRGLKRGTTIKVDPTKIFSRSAIPTIPEFYVDQQFTCKDCGKKEIWTARQQQRWYEDQGGEIEAIAIRCRSCRRREKARIAEARKIHLEGVARKQQQADS